VAEQTNGFVPLRVRPNYWLRAKAWIVEADVQLLEATEARQTAVSAA
jgi:hypothetical protein